MMTARMYRLTEIHQKIDERLRHELRKRRPDPRETGRLEQTRQRVKRLLRRLAPAQVTLAKPMPAPCG